MTEANSDVDPAVVPGKPSGSRRMIHILGAALVGVVLPVVVLYALLGNSAPGRCSIGLMVGVIGSKLGGTRRMLYLAPAVGIAGGTGADHRLPLVVGPVLLAVVAVIAGAGMLFGWLPSLLMLTFAATLPRVATSSGRSRGGVRRHRCDSHAVRRRAGAPFQGARGGRGPAGVPAGCGQRGDRVRHRAGRRGGDRRGPGLDRALRVPEPILLLLLYILMGKTRADTGKGDRHRARGHRRGTGGDRRAACTGDTVRRRGVPACVL